MEQYYYKINNIYERTLEYLENEDESQINFENLMIFFDQLKIAKDINIFQEILHLISKISNNHNRSQDMIPKIERILKEFKNEIINNFTNYEIFKIFKQNKRLLLFLFQEKMINPEYSIFINITNEKNKLKNYPSYFYPEFQSFFNVKNIFSRYERNMKEKFEMSKKEFEKNNEEFNLKRKIGENDHLICKLIQNDSIIEFIKYVNQTNISLSSQIDQSIFETNCFLLDKSPSLIEYAAFFGSIQIFQYLKINQVKLNPSLGVYSIHGFNAEMIHIIEENKIISSKNTYKDCLIESIKCHHNSIKNYIQTTKFNFNSNEHSKMILYNCLKYYNYTDFPNKFDVNDSTIFYFLCKYDYVNLAQFFLSANSNIDINMSNKISYFYFS